MRTAKILNNLAKLEPKQSIKSSLKLQFLLDIGVRVQKVVIARKQIVQKDIVNVLAQEISVANIANV